MRLGENEACGEGEFGWRWRVYVSITAQTTGRHETGEELLSILSNAVAKRDHEVEDSKTIDTTRREMDSGELGKE